MARFRDWRAQSVNFRRVEIAPDISIHIGIEGSWMSLPPEKLKRLGEIADILDALQVHPPPPASGGNEQS